MKRVFIIMFFFCITYNLFSAAVSQKYINLYLKQAEGLMLLGNYKYAIDLYDTVLKIDRENVFALIGKGNCYKLLNDTQGAEKNYNLAKSINPDIKIPDIWKYREREKLRKGDNTQIKKRYYELFGQQNTNISIDEIPLPTGDTEITENIKVTVTAKTEKPVAKQLTQAELLESMKQRQLIIRGGKARMLSMGGMKHIVPDMSTALDGAAFDIDAGFLFRKKEHVFNLSPLAGYYYKENKLITSQTVNHHALIVTPNNSYGEVGYPNDFLFSSIRPVYMNTLNVEQEIGSRVSNSGNQFGGMWILGFKPSPFFGIAGRFGYEHIPYGEAVESPGNTVTGGATFSKYEWQAGVGFCIPITPAFDNKIEITSCFGNYSPEPDYTNIKNNFLFNAPYSLFNGYTQSLSKTEPIVISTPPFFANKEYKDIFEATGYTVKTNLHFISGNCEHEVFFTLETPIDIKYFTQTEQTIKDITGLTTISTITTEKTQVGHSYDFSLKTGFRNDFKYIAIGARYELNTTSYYFYSTQLAKFSPNIIDSFVPDLLLQNSMQKAYRFLIGLNIKPIWIITFPIEFEYALNDINTDTIGLYHIEKIIRAGFEIRPVPLFAIRAGISYDYNLNSFARGYPFDVGTSENPILNLLTYTAGFGFDLPLFEFNIGLSYSRIYYTPLQLNVSDSTSYYITGMFDLNLYM
jgi:tetratricopeptide (TPR) repeat protein